MSSKAKAAAGKKAVELIQDGMTVGLGTGTTAYFFIKELGNRCRQGLKIQAVSTSLESENLAISEGIPLADINELEKIDIDVDGADEIDSQKRMIKGGGGALFREKIIASMSGEMVVIVDSSKQVDTLGKFPLPVEVSKFALKATLKHIQDMGCKGVLRKTQNNQLFQTDSRNLIYDIQLLYPCTNPEKIESGLKKIPGVIETGFFLKQAGRVIIGYDNGKIRVLD